ncbi:DNA primase [Alkalicoccus urumqiensis]|uniref:DNA primase n=1 Tax=Alkalicoccus urumqiensis TaxID=1548213 RepID=A0A2P6MFQ1_ALKUR|nr:DNA primase [Alkalicoccus urumqiensis]PRO65116.1 DNA primase [Alkalicoccus urumqiensis]
MSGQIPEETVDQIRRSVDIVDVISEYVNLKKQGRNFSGLCPFHGEKTPSFSVSQEKQVFYCFGCTEGGNVFSFLMKYHDMTFTEAAQMLAGKSGIDVDIPDQPETSQNGEDQWREGHSLSAKLYHHLLLQAPEGRAAREYLRARGFTRDMIERFQIGYAPDSWHYLSEFLDKRGMNLEEMADCGLLGRRNSDGKPYDQFRDRIMFPIWDKRGEVIAFGGRVLDSSQSPKYLNSPESSVFNKSRLLYYFHGARQVMRRKNEAVLFEGYVDVISAYRAGIEHGVGSLGTALSAEQAKMLRRNADRAVLCYDGDNAGRKAAWKNAAVLLQAGMQVLIAYLPDGMDPDDYIQEYGTERFARHIIGEPLTVMEFKSRVLKEGKNMALESDQLQFVEQMLKEIAALPSPVERDHYLRQLEEEFSLSYDVLRQEMSEQVQNKEKVQRKRERREAPPKPKSRIMSAGERAEQDLILFMMQSRTTAEEVEARIGADFQHETYQALAALLYSFYAEGHESSASRFIESLTDPDLQREAAAIAMKEVETDLTEEVMEDYINQVLHRTPMERQIDELMQKMRQSADKEEQTELMQQLVRLKTGRSGT